jgi:hypothetical protein
MSGIPLVSDPILAHGAGCVSITLLYPSLLPNRMPIVTFFFVDILALLHPALLIVSLIVQCTPNPEELFYKPFLKTTKSQFGDHVFFLSDVYTNFLFYSLLPLSCLGMV